METKKRILIVDDEPQIGRIFGLKLKLAGYDVVSTTSGADAIELIRADRFDVVLLDLLMPGVSGKEVLEKVRTFSQVAIIIFSATQDVSDIAKKLAADDSISKPMNPDQLVEKIKAVLSRNDNRPTPSQI